jgi:hypothetical protein
VQLARVDIVVLDSVGWTEDLGILKAFDTVHHL